MTRLRRPPATALVAALAFAGLCAIVAGVYVEVGLGFALIVGGVVAVAIGLLVDV